METASTQFGPLNLVWRAFWRKLALECANVDCAHGRRFWRPLGPRRRALIQVEGLSYCLEGCLDRALGAVLRRLQPRTAQTKASHRIPLGLVLLSRRQLSERQLRAALDRQRAAGRGRIGEWLQALGFVEEAQITAALAWQWSCPVLRAIPLAPMSPIPQIPAALQKSFLLMPIDYLEASRTLHVAFGERVDYSVLYAIEQMMGCHTEACIAMPGIMRSHLQAISQGRAAGEVVFEGVADEAELCRIVRSYATRLSAREIRVVNCGGHLWVRLFQGPSRPPLDLLLDSPPHVSGSSRAASAVSESG